MIDFLSAFAKLMRADISKSKPVNVGILLGKETLYELDPRASRH
jgi:hypothetical protein